MGILFGFTVAWTSREEMISETSIEFVYKIKNESIFIGGKKSKNRFYGYLIEDWISRKVLAKSISYNSSVCSSVIIINDGTTRCVVHTFQLKNIFYTSKYFLGLTLSWKKLVKYHCLLRLSGVDKRFLYRLYFLVFNRYWIMNTRSNLWFVPKNKFIFRKFFIGKNIHLEWVKYIEKIFQGFIDVITIYTYIYFKVEGSWNTG